jgi:ribosomal protein S18 acetylase RimI-like enzyme
MTAKVIQGSFLNGSPKWSMSVQPKIVEPSIETRRVTIPATSGFVGRRPGAPPSAFSAIQPGPPAPAFAPRRAAVQRHGSGGAFAVEAGSLGLASGGGKPLPAPVRGKMEAALGADFSNVRVHVGPQAERIGAIAFTVGSDIYFAPGRYQPDTLQGQQLLGHELAHVVQQRAGRVRNPLGSGLAVVQDHTLEVEADRLGQQAAMHRVAAQAKMRSSAAQPSAPVRISPPIGAGPGRYRLIAGARGRQVGSVTVHARDKGTVEVSDLHVAEGQRGRGIGKMLVASAAKAGQQFGSSTVTLAAQDNGSGHLTRWYREMGFTSIGVNQRGYPRLEAPISRILGGTAQRRMQWQGADPRRAWSPPKRELSKPVTSGADHRSLPTPQANSTRMFRFAPVLQRSGRVLQRMEAWGYCQNCGKPFPSATAKCTVCGGKIGPDDPRDRGTKPYEFYDAKIKGQIFDKSILNLNCGRYCATSAIEFWFPGITEDVLKDLLPKPKSSLLGMRYGWSPGKEGGECFKSLDKMPETMGQWLEELKKWGPLIVGGDFANVLNMGHVGHFVLVVGIIPPTGEQEGKIIVQDSFTTSSMGARIEWSFGKFQKTVESVYRVNKAKIEELTHLTRREQHETQWINNPLYEPEQWNPLYEPKK